MNDPDWYWIQNELEHQEYIETEVNDAKDSKS